MHTTAHHHVAVRKTDRHRKIGREPLEEEAAKVITQTTGKMDDGSAGWIFDYSRLATMTTTTTPKNAPLSNFIFSPPTTIRSKITGTYRNEMIWEILL